MSISQQIDTDIKEALLAGKKDVATTLRGLKSALLNEAIAKGVKDSGLSEADTIGVISKELKKRQESAELYLKANESERANQELSEKRTLEKYLPKQISDEELRQLVDEAIEGIEQPTFKHMGQVIGVIKAKVGTSADSGRIALAVKTRLDQ